MKFTIKKSTPPEYTPGPSFPPPTYNGDEFAPDVEYAPETCHSCHKTGFNYNCGNNSILHYQIHIEMNQMECSTLHGFVCYECISNDERNEHGFKLVLVSNDVKLNRTNEQIKIFADFCVDNIDLD